MCVANVWLEIPFWRNFNFTLFVCDYMIKIKIKRDNSKFYFYFLFMHSCVGTGHI